MTVRKAARRARAQQRVIKAAEAKAEQPKIDLEEFIANLPKDKQEDFRHGVKVGREVVYRNRCAGIDLRNNDGAFGSIKEAVDDPKNEEVILYYEGPVPGYIPQIPWLLTIKTPPEVDRKIGKFTLACGSWSQLISAVVAFGDKEARDDIRWLLVVQGITPISEEEFAAVRNEVEMVGKVESGNVDLWLAFARWVKLRLFPESEPNKVERIAFAFGKSFAETVRWLKKGQKENWEVVGLEGGVAETLRQMKMKEEAVE